jgi:hypothetical protein
MTIRNEPLQRAILFAASRVVPAGQREEWLAEWLTELWYARDENPGHATDFCRGALCDARWLRRNAPLARESGPLSIAPRADIPAPPPFESRFPESPAACLCMLALFGVLAAMLAIRFHNARLTPDVPGFLMLFPMSFGVLPVTTTLSFGDYPPSARGLRRWLFFAAKAALIVATVIFGIIAISGLHSPGWLQLGFWGAFWGFHLAMRWALADQRSRCPVCLHRLANPVRMGNSSRILLEWNGTELLCERGHGLLHVPERPAIWFTKQRWISL